MYHLVPVRLEDIESIRIWRNAQREVLRQNEELTKEAQETYFATFVWPYKWVTDPSQVLYSFLEGPVCIGYGGFTHIDWVARRAELSFLLDPSRVADEDRYRRDFLFFLGEICKEARDRWDLHQIFAETFAFRQIHIQVLEDFGFQRMAILPRRVHKRGEWVDALIHELILK